MTTRLPHEVSPAHGRDAELTPSRVAKDRGGDALTSRCWGPLDGREIDVEVNEDGQPPPQPLAESWLWLACGSELLEEDLGGRFGWEPVAGFGPPWLYVWIERHSPLGSQAPTAVNP
jgi:hypothetical protein